MLTLVGEFNEKGDATVLVAATAGGTVVGGIVYFSDMALYGWGGRRPV